jgi:hypothetical protein
MKFHEVFCCMGHCSIELSNLLFFHLIFFPLQKTALLAAAEVVSVLLLARETVADSSRSWAVEFWQS